MCAPARSRRCRCTRLCTKVSQPPRCSSMRYSRLPSATLSACGARPCVASDPALGLLNIIFALPGNQSDLLGYSLQWAGFWLLMAWIAFIFWRAIAVSMMPRQPRFWLRSLTGAALLLAGVPLAIWAHQPWFYSTPTAALQGTQYPSPVSEAVLIKQPQLLYEAVTELEDERPRITDLISSPSRRTRPRTYSARTSKSRATCSTTASTPTAVRSR